MQFPRPDGLRLIVDVRDQVVGRLFVGNFDFEHRLAAPGAEPSRVVRRKCAELSFVWSTVASAEDVILGGGLPDRDFLSELQALGFPRLQWHTSPSPADRGLDVCPWGWDASLLDWSRRHGLHCNGPAAEVVREVNARDFSSRIETQSQTGLPGARRVSGLDELDATLRGLAQTAPDWVIKARFGMAGRECVRGRGHGLDAAQRNWVVTRLQRDGVVFCEPWVERIEEISWQFDVPAASAGLAGAAPRLLGATELVTDHRGAHRGNRSFSVDQITAGCSADWQPAMDVVTDLADEAQRRGYSGPLGVDSMKYRAPDGSVAVRAVQDVNARWTMGRLAWELRRLAEPAAHVGWWHVRWAARQSPRDWCRALRDSGGTSVRVFRTSPYEIDGRPVELGTLAVIGADPQAVRRVERDILESSLDG